MTPPPYQRETRRTCDFSRWRILLLKRLDYLLAPYPGEQEMRDCYQQGQTPQEAITILLPSFSKES